MGTRNYEPTKETTLGQIDRARELRAEGLSGHDVAAEMGVSLRTVWRYLSAPAPVPCPCCGRLTPGEPEGR